MSGCGGWPPYLHIAVFTCYSIMPADTESTIKPQSVEASGGQDLKKIENSMECIYLCMCRLFVVWESLLMYVCVCLQISLGEAKKAD